MTHTIVVGAGILGLALARRAQLGSPSTRVTVVEKEDRVAAHQTGRNSGVVHAGLYYTPGSLKARLCVRGAELLRSYCQDNDLPYEECGKLVVATHEEQVPRLRELARRAEGNGVRGLAFVEPHEIRTIEPHATGVLALHSPHTAIVDFGSVAQRFASEIQERGADLRLGTEVVGVTESDGKVEVATTRGTLVGDELVVCAGLQSDRLAQLVGDDPAPQVVPFRGDYFALTADARELVRGLIYPVPDPRYPFLGIHLTKRIDGGVLVGPNALLAPGREAYRLRDAKVTDLLQTLRYSGFQHLARLHWTTGARELAHSASKTLFAESARAFVPVLRRSHLQRAAPGIRAQAVDPDGSLVDDFRITRTGRVTIVRNAPSPAATSSLAIAEHLLPG